ncbi:putative uncharacterized protein C3orf49 homolog [Sminthopsis crassicaudata]|uniref:putative uncharacterized protein C3orf49 homolog n=1 Tax=Sminthopsis crassicaudata TaxID=9301 RepID=UPI003D69BEDA
MYPFPRHFPESFKITCGKRRQSKSFLPTKRKHGPFKRKGIERWHRAVSTNLAKQNLLVPKEESSSGSDLESQQSPENKKKNFMKKIKTAFKRTLPEQYRIKVAKSNKSYPSNHKEALFSNRQSLLSRIAKERPSPRLFAKPQIGKLPQNATIQLDVVEAETEEITGGNTLVRARRTTRRLSVTPLPSGLQKVSYLSKKRRHFPMLRKKKPNMENILCASDLTVGKLQMQVDDLIETVTEKSMKLLAQRHAELQQCEFLGDEILQSSKQFQRVSKRTMRKYKLKNVCFPCTCCCY